MTAGVRSLFRTTAADAPISLAEPVDYCQCGRGEVVGLLSYTNSRVLFRTAVEGTPTRDQGAADLRCLDCVADAIAEVASGEVTRRMREAVKSRRGVA